MAAAFPGEPTYVVKKELADQFFAGALLRRLGVLFLNVLNWRTALPTSQT